ncbi:hypothetical protein GSI_11907 [Ganoderma sinense ZZ0214-1]|uniref:Uncharacterized protein n=1 Tax=Ganoderma sinense ZZ0214-1 TaxID=1077348 RepID=A0A2G8RXC3_9APHY|nr:hypothetical protein GSI_11907 [Ganoderma sinense ZZ0214-1]
MWLLSTDRAELHAFVSPGDVPNGYAILSHVWNKEEQSFQDLRALQRECAADGSNPRDKASEKIRRCCEVAESHGFQWIWNDTCCIDKTSSAELSEAINSMYRYYSLTKVCFAYLGDVSRLYEFDESRWHQRGWTLQELLAPRLVVFLSRDWTVLGTKFKLSATLEQVTGIPATVLRHEMRPADLSIAVRMGFAARRVTTRPEDRAYSLMGLFDVNIPTLYGEGGERAFRRLQEEIMKHSPDTTLFAWGAALAAHRLGTPPKLEHPSHADNRSLLFASSPSDFDSCQTVRFKPYKVDETPLLDMDDDQWLDLAAHVPTFSITPYGILAHIFIINWRGLIVALLGWLEGDHRCGLILNPCEHPVDPQHQLFDISVEVDVYLNKTMFRLVTFNEDDDDVSITSAGWRDVYLSHRPLASNLESSFVPDPWGSIQFLELDLESPFCFSQEGTSGLVLTEARGPLLGESSGTLLSWTGAEPLLLSFEHRRSRHRTCVTIRVGRCTNRAGGFSAHNLGPHWMTISTDPRAAAPGGEHSCATDHFSIPDLWSTTWREHRIGSALGEHGQSLYVGFEQCSFNPERLVVTLADRI